MRTLTIGTQKHTRVDVMDEKGPGGANHVYNIVLAGSTLGAIPLCEVGFQKGPVKEEGVNGIHNEDLLAIVIDRLDGFQQGAYKCRENALALTKLQEALLWLGARTDGREKRGVEGTSAR